MLSNIENLNSKCKNIPFEKQVTNNNNISYLKHKDEPLCARSSALWTSRINKILQSSYIHNSNGSLPIQFLKFNPSSSTKAK